jgi:hypothetical protein
MVSDQDMLEDLLDDERVEGSERKAFQSMLDDLRPGGFLSRKQRKWVQGRWERLELGVGGSLNLHSSGQVPDADPTSPNAVTFPWEKSNYQKPLKPPGRSDT